MMEAKAYNQTISAVDTASRYEMSIRRSFYIIMSKKTVFYGFLGFGSNETQELAGDPKNRGNVFLDI